MKTQSFYNHYTRFGIVHYKIIYDVTGIALWTENNNLYLMVGADVYQTFAIRSVHTVLVSR